ncbi:MAG: DUF3570 domain-containing protein [Deltaproteobacteria bacterium]|nr:DUF3570 domain-containing protein [Deltaproteobacteria bacterium]
MRRFRRGFFFLLTVMALALALAPRGVRAENSVTVRGQYYREPSTRVVQPVVHIVSELPAGLDVSAHYLLDAITSASAAAAPDGDTIFTEYRNESGISLGKTWSRLRVGAAYKYSAESDYWSHTLALFAALRTWSDTATWALSAGFGHDDVSRRMQVNAPPGTTPGSPTCIPSAAITCPMTSVFSGLGYSQVLSPTLLVQGGYEVLVLNGFIASPYRADVLPDNRVRQALSARAAKYFPTTKTGIQLQVRHYWDLKWNQSDPLLVLRSFAGDEAENPWQVRSQTAEARIFQGIGRDVDLRLTGRFYSQGPVNFRCDQGTTPGCYSGPAYTTTDPKLAQVGTVFVEAKAYWEATSLRGQPFFGWFSEGTFELSYGMFFQNTAFANAHVLQTGYALPF